MAADYPTSTKSFSTKVDNVDLVMAADINDIQTEVAAIETQLVTSKLATLAAAPVGNQVLTSVAGVPTWAGDWQSWTPVKTNITESGTVIWDCRFCRIGNLVTISLRIDVQSGSVTGTDASLSLPFTPSYGASTVLVTSARALFCYCLAFTDGNLYFATSINAGIATYYANLQYETA